MGGRLTTHVLDTAHGRPAANIALTLWRIDSSAGTEQRTLLKTVRTNADGRTPEPLLADDELTIGVYELVFAVGEAAARAAVAGQSGFMVKIVRQGQLNSIKWSTDLQSLADIANVEHFIPRDWISEDGFLPNEKFVEYAQPLIEGEVKVPVENGLPKYVTLEKSKVEKKLPPR